MVVLTNELDSQVNERKQGMKTMSKLLSLLELIIKVCIKGKNRKLKTGGGAPHSQHEQKTTTKKNP